MNLTRRREWRPLPTMQRILLILLSMVLWSTHWSVAQPAQAETTKPQIMAAANKFLDTLDDGQRKKAVFDFKDEAQRKRWSNFPTAMFSRAGLRMGDLTQPQRDAALAVLAAMLSPQGYEKVLQIVEGDEALKRKEGGRPIFGHDEYFISFLGQPSAAEPWMIQFGGHHLAINVTLAGEQGTLAPSHTAAQPATYEFEGKTVRPLGRETDKAFALISLLDEAQRKQAVLGFQMRDLVLGPGRDGQMIQPEGIKGSNLNDQQREMMLDLADEWTGIRPGPTGVNQNHTAPCHVLGSFQLSCCAGPTGPSSSGRCTPLPRRPQWPPNFNHAN